MDKALAGQVPPVEGKEGLQRYVGVPEPVEVFVEALVKGEGFVELS